MRSLLTHHELDTETQLIKFHDQRWVLIVWLTSHKSASHWPMKRLSCFFRFASGEILAAPKRETKRGACAGASLPAADVQITAVRCALCVTPSRYFEYYQLSFMLSQTVEAPGRGEPSKICRPYWDRHRLNERTTDEEGIDSPSSRLSALNVTGLYVTLSLLCLPKESSFPCLNIQSRHAVTDWSRLQFICFVPVYYVKLYYLFFFFFYQTRTGQ